MPVINEFQRVYRLARAMPLSLHNKAGRAVWNVDKIRIGAHATVSQDSFLFTASHDYTDPAMPLVTARSSVFSDIEPWVVAAGNPATAVKQRTWISREANPDV